MTRALDDSDICLIERVKLTPSLYDARNPNFRLAYRKEHDWNNVAADLGIKSASDARRRWTCLRDRYTRELKQLRLNPYKGDYGKNEFFRLMDFLRSFVRKRRERRRNPMYKYDSSWDGSSADGSKPTTKYEGDAIEDDEILKEENEDHCCEESQQITEHYSEYVEVTHEPFEEYVENQSLHTSSQNVPAATIKNPLYNVQQRSKTVVNQQQQEHESVNQHNRNNSVSSKEFSNENEDDYFCKSIAAYLRQLSRRHKIKAKVEMFQILEKYINLEENGEECNNDRKG